MRFSRVCLLLAVLGLFTLGVKAQEIPSVIKEGSRILNQEGPKEAIKFFEECKSDPLLEQWCELGLVVCLRWKGEAEAALEKMEKIQPKDGLLQGLFLYTQGTLYSDLGQTEKAIRSIKDARVKYEGLDYTSGMMECDLLLVHIYLKAERFYAAEALVSDLRLYVEKGSQNESFIFYINSFFSIKRGEWTYALLNIKKAHAQYKENGMIYFQSLASTIQAFLYIMLEDFEAARFSLADAVNEHAISGMNSSIIDDFHLLLRSHCFQAGEESVDTKNLKSRLQGKLNANPNYMFEEILKNL